MRSISHIVEDDSPQLLSVVAFVEFQLLSLSCNYLSTILTCLHLVQAVIYAVIYGELFTTFLSNLLIFNGFPELISSSIHSLKHIETCCSVGTSVMPLYIFVYVLYYMQMSRRESRGAEGQVLISCRTLVFLLFIYFVLFCIQIPFLVDFYLFLNCSLVSCRLGRSLRSRQISAMFQTADTYSLYIRIRMYVCM